MIVSRQLSSTQLGATRLKSCFLFFLFFIRITSFWNIVGGMGPSLCISSLVTIRQILPPEILILTKVENGLRDLQNSLKMPNKNQKSLETTKFLELMIRTA